MHAATMQLTDRIALVGSGEARISDRIDCNVYAFNAPEGVVLVDTGGGRATERIIENTVEAFGSQPSTVLLTHCHSDHSQGAPYLQQRSVSVLCSDATASLVADGSDVELGLDRARHDGVYPEDYEFTHFTADRVLSPPTEFSVEGQPFEIVNVRGHALDHCCYLTTVGDKTVCFSADAVTVDGSILLLNMEGSSLSDYRAHIDKLVERRIDMLLPGHGLPRLEAGHESVEEAAAALSGLTTPSSMT